MNYATKNSKAVMRMCEYGETVIESLRADDPRLCGSVHLKHTDGSETVVRNAFPECAGDWLFVFSQTDGFVLYKKQDVAHWSKSSRMDRPQLAGHVIARSAIANAA